MKNVEIEVDGDELVIVVDLSMEFGFSKSGKNVIVATTGGNHKIGDSTSVSLNVFKKDERE